MEGRVPPVGFHVIVFLGTKVARHDDRAANVAAECKGNEDQGDLVAVAHSGQGVFTDQLARHKAVGNVVELLEQDAAEHGQAELPQHLGRGANGQVFVHVKKSSSIFGSLLSIYHFTVPSSECKPTNLHTAPFPAFCRIRTRPGGHPINVYSGKHPQTLLRKGAGRGRIKAVS